MSGNNSEFFKKSKLLTVFSGNIPTPLPPNEYLLIDTNDDFFISTDNDFYVVDLF